jgi:hypothetical protein
MRACLIALKALLAAQAEAYRQLRKEPQRANDQQSDELEEP